MVLLGPIQTITAQDLGALQDITQDHPGLFSILAHLVTFMEVLEVEIGSMML